MELAKLAGAKRALLLPVSAPFHSALMQPAAVAMEAALQSVERNSSAHAAARRQRRSLRGRRTGSDPIGPRRGGDGTVRWRESVAYMSAHGVTRFIELGAGKVLTGLIKRIVEGATAISIGAPADVAAFSAPAKP